VARLAARGVPDVLAAVDLGSNSFHLVVARYSHGQLTVIDRMREMVQLGAGLDAEGRLDREVANRALACLERFGQRLRDMRPGRVRVVGTNALRRAHQKRQFLQRARTALGHPIEIVSGMEEARLIYSGVAHTLPRDAERRLVIDIGGGSTELIIGEGFAPLELESTQLGCVSLSREFFAGGRVSSKRMARARVACRLEIEPLQTKFRRRGWDQAVGSSGTVRSISDAIRELDPAATAITPEGLEAVLDVTVAAGQARDLPFTSLTDERKQVFPGGLAILAEVFEVLGLERLRAADGAMREGLLYDLIGRFTNEDARDRSVRGMQARYHVEMAQAERVERTAVALLGQVAAAWDLEDPLAEQVLSWAARLHEIGLDVSHSKYHQHSAYLLENADMAGFPREEQRLLARLVGSHRRKMPTAELLEQLLPPWDKSAVLLIVVLRLAVLLHRSRSDARLPEVQLTAKGRTLELRFPGRWLKDHPLTAADLTQEIALLRAADFRLRVFSRRA